MQPPLLNKLPLPLALMYYSLAHVRPLAIRGHLVLAETMVQYVEYVLRAQCSDTSDHQRPLSFGRRVSTIQRLTKDLELKQEEPFISLWNDQKDRENLNQLVSNRNRWAHHRTSMEPQATSEQLLTQLEQLLRNVCSGDLIWLKREDSGPPVPLHLQGLRSLYEPEVYQWEAGFDQWEEGRLYITDGKSRARALYPFLDAATGESGEHRVLVQTFQGKEVLYLDPTQDFISNGFS